MCCELFLQRFLYRLEVMIPAYDFSRFVYHLFCELALHWPFSILTENGSSLNEAQEVYSKGLWMESPHIFSL